MAEIAEGGTASESETAPTKSWQRRPFLASSARAAISLAPIVVSSATALALNHFLPRPVSVVALVARVGLILVASFIALAVVDRQARKLLPLAALLQLSLLFPDQMPNRFRIALKAGSSRRLALEVDRARLHGLSDERALASEQLVLLATAIGDHDKRTRGHSERVRLFADLVADQLGLSAEERGKLQWAALIHDIGKISVPAEILNKKGALTKREWEILQRHPAQGEALAGPVAPWLGEWVHAVGGHHEKWDGTGYPRGLSGSAIPRAAAIVAVADSFEVMTAVRSYKKAMPLAEARAELTRCAGTHFDPDIVRALLNVSIGRLRGAMGVFAGLAHIPFIGPLTTAAAHAPDTVSAAVGATTAGASTGLTMAAIGGAMVLGPNTPTGAPAPPPAVVSVSAPELAPEVLAVDPAPPRPLPETAPVPPPPAVAAPVSRPVVAKPTVAPSSITPTPIALASVVPAEKSSDDDDESLVAAQSVPATSDEDDSDRRDGEDEHVNREAEHQLARASSRRDD